MTATIALLGARPGQAVPSSFHLQRQLDLLALPIGKAGNRVAVSVPPFRQTIGEENHAQEVADGCPGSRRRGSSTCCSGVGGSNAQSQSARCAHGQRPGSGKSRYTNGSEFQWTGSDLRRRGQPSGPGDFHPGRNRPGDSGPGAPRDDLAAGRHAAGPGCYGPRCARRTANERILRTNWVAEPAGSADRLPAGPAEPGASSVAEPAGPADRQPAGPDEPGASSVAEPAWPDRPAEPSAGPAVNRVAAQQTS